MPTFCNPKNLGGYPSNNNKNNSNKTLHLLSVISVEMILLGKRPLASIINLTDRQKYPRFLWNIFIQYKF